jgi:hypothetical protein
MHAVFVYDTRSIIYALHAVALVVSQVAFKRVCVHACMQLWYMSWRRMYVRLVMIRQEIQILAASMSLQMIHFRVQYAFENAFLKTKSEDDLLKMC